MTRSNWRKKGSDSLFIYFLVLNLFDKWVQWFISGKTSSMGRGFNIFQGVQSLIPMETYRTCNFPGAILIPIGTCKRLLKKMTAIMIIGPGITAYQVT